MNGYVKLFSGFQADQGIIDQLVGIDSYDFFSVREVKEFENKTFWNKFEKDDLGLAFTRNAHQIVKEFAIGVAEKLSSMFPRYEFDYHHINFIRNYRDIPWHVDYYRKCTLNIGLKNSNFAETRVIGNSQPYVMQDGDGYLLDILKPHSVKWIGPTGPTRYQITYGFFDVKNFEEACKLLID